VGGAFIGSESGRTYPVTDREGTFLTTAAAASRKDARDAVVAARTALRTWSSASAHHRGQVLARIAEMLEGRRDELVGLVRDADGVDDATAQQLVSASVDRWVWYAGWADKLTHLAGAVNPVAGPYVSFSVPEPTGVVAVVAPQRDSLLGLVSVLAPVLTTGCTAVVLASEHRPGPAISLAEVLATADVPPGAVNILTGAAEEVASWLAGHADVNAVDLTGAEPALGTACAQAAARTLMRVRRPDAEADWTATPSLERLLWLLEIKTVWQTVGL
jgi:acyl-CoA reductase-like NAD-dependent aldehyde dehydrogenase